MEQAASMASSPTGNQEASSQIMDPNAFLYGMGANDYPQTDIGDISSPPVQEKSTPGPHKKRRKEHRQHESDKRKKKHKHHRTLENEDEDYDEEAFDENVAYTNATQSHTHADSIPPPTQNHFPASNIVPNFNQPRSANRLVPFARHLGEADNDQYDFELIFNQFDTLQQMLAIVGETITDIPFCVQCNEHFKGISIETMDARNACYISARLNCQVRLSDESMDNTVFCVRAKPLNESLNSLNLQSSLRVVRPVEKTDILFTAVDNTTHIENEGFRIPVIDYDPTDDSLAPMRHDYTIDMTLVAMRSIVKTAKNLRATALTFTVLEKREEPADQDLVVDKPKYTFLRIEIKSCETVQLFKTFCSVTNWEHNVDEQGMVATNAPQEFIEDDVLNNLEEKFQASFPNDYLGYFLSKMKRPTLRLSLSQGLPLVITYPMGNDQSYIKCALSAQVDDVLSDN